MNIGDGYMQTFSYTIGSWHAEAKLQEVGEGKLMAIISVSDKKDTAATGSKHTVVFDHQRGKDKNEETEVLVRRLIWERYGI
jgi:hypothetical protein